MQLSGLEKPGQPQPQITSLHKTAVLSDKLIWNPVLPSSWACSCACPCLMCRLLDPDLPPEALNSTSHLCCLKALGQLQPAAWQGPEMWWLLVLPSLVQVGGVLPPGASAVCPCFCPWPWGSALPHLTELLPVGLLSELRWAGTPQRLVLQGTARVQQAQSTLQTSSF